MADDKKKSPLNVDVQARAEAKLEIRTEVPPKAAGRFVDALTDILRPISENRGLRADHIRLQREDVAIQISEKVRERLALENKPITPIPNKILLPWLEAASTEDVDDTFMHDLWANLLTSAAIRAKVQPRYVGILKEIQGRQAEKFEKLARNQEEEFDRPIAHFIDAATTLEASMVRQSLAQFFEESDRKPDVGSIYASVLHWIDVPGCAIIDIIVHDDGASYSMPGDELLFSEKNDALDLEILTSLGLCVRVNEFYRGGYDIDVQIVYYKVTELGVQFFLSCNLLDPEEIVETGASNEYPDQ